MERNSEFLFLGYRSDLGHFKLPKSWDFDESRFHRTQLVIGAMECSDSGTEIVTEPGNRNVEHQCRLCNKIFSSYQRSRVVIRRSIR